VNKHESLDTVKQAKIINIATATSLFLVGVLLLLPLMELNTEKFVIGGLCAVVGAAKIYGYFANDLYRLAFQYDMAIGLYALIFSILFLVSPERFNAVFSPVIGTYVLLEGTFKLQVAFDARRFGMLQWHLMLGTALTLCAIGVLTVISYYSDLLSETLFRAIALMAIGAENAWITLYTVRVRTKKKKFSDWVGQGALSEEDM
jgi:uncharacterized membrane protein HdeD (DUF308 family)